LRRLHRDQPLRHRLPFIFVCLANEASGMVARTLFDEAALTGSLMDHLIDINARADTHYVFLFTDIEGSTQRWARYPDAMGAAMARHDTLLRDGVAAAGGAVFKTTGDGGCAVFARVQAALTAAAWLQTRLGEEDFAAVGGLKFRIGVHTGPAEFRDDDYFGLTLGRTARIMAAGHGGQILVSAAVAAAGGVPEPYALQSLGMHRLKDLGQAEEIFQLTGPELATGFPPLRTLNARPHNLPEQTSTLIGREGALADLRGLLARHKLVTVLGPGGIGKTRLALQSTAEALENYADGVWLVELAGVSQGEQVAASAAAALNIALSGGGNAAEQFASALRGAAMLIILDNCEHLIEAAAALADAVLRRNPGVTILATSRSPLGVPGEQSFALPTLAVPALEAIAGMTVADAATYAGIELFVARANLVQPGFALAADNAADIAAICQRLDGIALAIELAAARIRMMRPKDLLARLNDRFRLLTGGARTHLPRQQTLRALIDWSFALLSETERIAFRRLGVFAGSFDLSAAEAVLAGRDIEALEVLDLVASLLDKSLVTRLPAAGEEPRYRLLDSTRAYALEALAQAGEAQALRRAHAAHMVTLFGAAEDRYWNTDTLVWRASVEPEIENLLVTLEWAFSDAGDDALATALAARLRPLAQQALLARPTFFAFVRTAITKLTPDTPTKDAARLWSALSGDQSAGARACATASETARALFEMLQDRPMAGLAAARTAFLLLRAGDEAQGRRFAEAARAILPIIKPNLIQAGMLGDLAAYQALAGSDATAMNAARRDYAASLEICEKFNDQSGVLIVSASLAELQAKLGDYGGAITSAKRNVSLSRAQRDWYGLTYSLLNLTSYALLAGDDAAAAQAAREAVPLVIELEDHHIGACFTGSLALLAARAGALAVAAQLAGHTENFWTAHQETMQPIEQRVWDALMALFEAAAAAGTLLAETRIALMAQGATLSLRAALELKFGL
jgi:predicted ATPase/class 3 adenylate cyclase